jgi:hypothetical protein
MAAPAFAAARCAYFVDHHAFQQHRLVLSTTGIHTLAAKTRLQCLSDEWLVVSHALQ